MITVDRILNNLAVCIKDGSPIDIPLTDINGKVCEGDILKWDESSTRYSVDADDTQKRYNAISERFSRIKKNMRL